jgi:arylsulfatase A-like enzyme
MISTIVTRTFKRTILCICALVFVAGAVEAADKPNIVVFLTDDQGYGDLGCFGSDSLETPNIDRLCRQGMKFTDFYVHQRCSPTRLAFMTGSHAHRAGCTKVIYNRDRIGIHPDEVTTPELLKKAGYATGIVGKW